QDAAREYSRGHRALARRLGRAARHAAAGGDGDPPRQRREAAGADRESAELQRLADEDGVARALGIRAEAAGFRRAEPASPADIESENQASAEHQPDARSRRRR